MPRVPAAAGESSRDAVAPQVPRCSGRTRVQRARVRGRPSVASSHAPSSPAIAPSPRRPSSGPWRRVHPTSSRTRLVAEGQLFFGGWFLCDFLFGGGRTAVDLFLTREISVDACEAILKELRRGYPQARARRPQRESRRVLQARGPVFYFLWLQHVAALRPSPRMVTAEGDDVVRARVVFDVQDREAVATALAGQPDLGRQDDVSYVWLQDTAELRRRLDLVVLEGSRLVFEATSRPRAERRRTMI